MKETQSDPTAAKIDHLSVGCRAVREHTVGQLWTVTNYTLHRHNAIDFKTCWKRFIQYLFFTWWSDLLFEHDWIPKCPHCNTRRGVEIKKSLVAARLIYGEAELSL
jgi:hypothetical protein